MGWNKSAKFLESSNRVRENSKTRERHRDCRHLQTELSIPCCGNCDQKSDEFTPQAAFHSTMAIRRLAHGARTTQNPGWFHLPFPCTSRQISCFVFSAFWLGLWTNMAPRPHSDRAVLLTKAWMQTSQVLGSQKETSWNTGIQVFFSAWWKLALSRFYE